MDERGWEFLTSFQEFMDDAVAHVRQLQQGGRQISEVLREHLGVDPTELPVVRFDIQPHQFVNLDVAMEAIVTEHGGGRVVGVGGGDQRHHQTFGDMLLGGGARVWGRLPVGPVDRIRLNTGPATHRDGVAYGVHLFRYGDVPVAVLQRNSNPRYGNRGGVEAVAANGSREVTDALLSDVRRLMVERSVFRGRLLSFGEVEEAYGSTVGGVTFLERPTLTAADVVLPEGSLERVERHVAGTARRRDVLRAAGQHLKRGLLLYGPPGTGKTHTVRYLISRMPGVTVVVLAGNALAFVAEATELAHALEPSVVVMEDVDLIAEHRESRLGPQPLLFTLLDAMDGLTGEADVAFLLTTNRADLLEAALAQRPGRVDLAVEIPLPDVAARQRLVGLYARDLHFSAEALGATAEGTAGATASLFKELFRRAVLVAAERDAEPDDDALREALAELLGDGERLTRALLGHADEDGGSAPPGPAGPPGPLGPARLRGGRP